MSKKQRVACFIDGFNLYHAINSFRQPYLKWLNLSKLMGQFIDPQEQEITAIYYFSAYAHWLVDAELRHKEYIKALKMVMVKPILGQFKEKQRNCRECNVSWIGHEEKETDVNIAIWMLNEAYKDTFDTAFLISRDSDLVPAVKMIKSNFPNKKIKIIAPSNNKHSKDLAKAADYTSTISYNNIETSLLPDIISYKKITAIMPIEYTKTYSKYIPTTPSNFFIICDHASNYIPPSLKNLGLPEKELARHIAWDIGALDLTRELAKLLNSKAIWANVSRLVIDLNRAPNDIGSIPEKSDQTTIFGNRKITAKNREKRVNHIHIPYHQAVEETLKEIPQPIIIAIHSFTPEMNGQKRPWEIGVLWNQDERLARPLIEALTKAGKIVGDNQPYSGKEFYYTLNRHAESANIPNVALEIRQDLLDTKEKAQEWAIFLSNMILEIVNSQMIFASAIPTAE